MAVMGSCRNLLGTCVVLQGWFNSCVAVVLFQNSRGAAADKQLQGICGAPVGCLGDGFETLAGHFRVC
jgi:hypothetical protein